MPGESQGQGSLVGCRLWGRTESDTTEVTQQQFELIFVFCELKVKVWLFSFSYGYLVISPLFVAENFFPY